MLLLIIWTCIVPATGFLDGGWHMLTVPPSFVKPYRTLIPSNRYRSTSNIRIPTYDEKKRNEWRDTGDVDRAPRAVNEWRDTGDVDRAPRAVASDDFIAMKGKKNLQENSNDLLKWLDSYNKIGYGTRLPKHSFQFLKTVNGSRGKRSSLPSNKKFVDWIQNVIRIQQYDGENPMYLFKKGLNVMPDAFSKLLNWQDIQMRLDDIFLNAKTDYTLANNLFLNKYRQEITGAEHNKRPLTQDKMLEEYSTMLLPNKRIDENSGPGPESRIAAMDSSETMPSVRENLVPEFYHNLCPSRSTFELVNTGINDKLETVQILPNTWIWTTNCVNTGRSCPHTKPNAHAACKQKKSWVQAFARLQDNDPWRWHWIAINSSCNCGVPVRDFLF